MGELIFGGISSKEIGLEVEHFPDFEIPERDYTVTHVPGRNGDVIWDNGSYKNVSRKYDISIGRFGMDNHQETYEQMAVRVLNWLHQSSGYLRLEDSYEPSYYRLASYKENANLTNILAQGGKATITFDCKPQRFLKEDTHWIISHAYHAAEPVKAFEERTYGFSPYMRVEIYPALDESDPDKASSNQPDEVWIAVRLDEEDEVIGTIKFLDVQSHIGRDHDKDDTLVVDIDFVYGKCLGIYKWVNNVLVPYTPYSKTNFAFSVNMISAVMENKEMYYTARGIQYGEEDPYGTDELIIKMSCNMRRYLV